MSINCTAYSNIQTAQIHWGLNLCKLVSVYHNKSTAHRCWMLDFFVSDIKLPIIVYIEKIVFLEKKMQVKNGK